MSEKLMVQETVFNGSAGEGDGWPPEDPAGFMAWFQERIDSIPEEHRAAANIAFTSEGGYYGDHSAHIEITYMRPETDEQFASRLAREERERQARAQQVEFNERRTLAALLAKYGQQPAA